MIKYLLWVCYFSIPIHDCLRQLYSVLTELIMCINPVLNSYSKKHKRQFYSKKNHQNNSSHSSVQAINWKTTNNTMVS